MKHEIVREALLISFHLLLEPLCGDAVKSRQVRIENHLLTTDFMDGRLDSLKGEGFRSCRSLTGDIPAPSLLSSLLRCPRILLGDLRCRRMAFSSRADSANCFRKINPRTTRLSAASMLERSLSAASHSFASKPTLAVLWFELRDERAMTLRFYLAEWRDGRQKADECWLAPMAG